MTDETPDYGQRKGDNEAEVREHTPADRAVTAEVQARQELDNARRLGSTDRETAARKVLAALGVDIDAEDAAERRRAQAETTGRAQADPPRKRQATPPQRSTTNR